MNTSLKNDGLVCVCNSRTLRLKSLTVDLSNVKRLAKSMPKCRIVPYDMN
jgi:hypothetical protein